MPRAGRQRRCRNRVASCSQFFGPTPGLVLSLRLVGAEDAGHHPSGGDEAFVDVVDAVPLAGGEQHAVTLADHAHVHFGIVMSLWTMAIITSVRTRLLDRPAARISRGSDDRLNRSIDASSCSRFSRRIPSACSHVV